MSSSESELEYESESSSDSSYHDNSDNEFEYESLIDALEEQETDTALKMLQHEWCVASLNTERDDEEKTALMYAAVLDDGGEMVALLLDKGADTDLVDNRQYTALMIATTHNRLDTMAVLLDRGANADLHDARHRTALVMATSQGRLDTMTVLLERGAQVDTLFLGHNTALQVAVDDGNVGAVRLLLEWGADGDRACLPVVRHMNNSDDIIQLMARHGATISLLDAEKETWLEQDVDAITDGLKQSCSVSYRQLQQHGLFPNDVARCVTQLAFPNYVYEHHFCRVECGVCDASVCSIEVDAHRKRHGADLQQLREEVKLLKTELKHTREHGSRKRRRP